jgi:hypothetical protein
MGPMTSTASLRLWARYHRLPNKLIQGFGLLPPEEQTWEALEVEVRPHRGLVAGAVHMSKNHLGRSAEILLLKHHPAGLPTCHEIVVSSYFFPWWLNHPS